MGFRFRRSLTIAPGLRLNLTGGGASLSVGPRGSSITMGSRGTFFNAGIPGTGLSARSRLGPSSGSKRAVSAESTSTVSIKVGIRDDGTIFFQDEAGHGLSDRQIALVKKNHPDTIRHLMEQMCQQINQEIEGIGDIHEQTPSPHSRPGWPMVPFADPKPVSVPPLPLSWWARWFPSKRRAHQRQVQATQSAFERSQQQWVTQQLEWEAQHQYRQQLLNLAREGRQEAIEECVSAIFRSLTWPRETQVSFEVGEDGTSICLDVDLPEIADMPTKLATVPQRGSKLSVKEMSPTQVQRLYMRHVHGIGFRLVGELFAWLPSINRVVVSGYSQRTNAATGHMEDQYLYSVRVTRVQWETLNFTNLSDVDVVETLPQFDLRRKMTKTGKFTPVVPWEHSSP